MHFVGCRAPNPINPLRLRRTQLYATRLKKPHKTRADLRNAGNDRARPAAMLCPFTLAACSRRATECGTVFRCRN